MFTVEKENLEEMGAEITTREINWALSNSTNGIRKFSSRS